MQYETDARALLESPELSVVMGRFSRECLLRKDLCSMPLPAGISHDEAWAFAASVRRLFSIEIPIRSPQGHVLWYFRHQGILDQLCEIERHCRADSDLHRELAEREGSPFVVKTQIEEAIATSQLDGLDIPSDHARALLRMDRKPRHGEERLVLNTYNAISTMHRLVDEKFTPELLRDLHDQVIDGVDPLSLKRSQERFGLCRSVYRDLVDPGSTGHIEEICAYANNEIGDRDEHPAIRALNLRGAIKQWQPLPDWNGNMASLVWKLYCLKQGYPVLGYLPVCRAILNWENGETAPPAVLSPSLPEQWVDDQGREDYTPNVTISLQLVHLELQGLRERVALRKDRDGEVLGSLEEDSTLNHRQRSILSRALRHPEAEFTIRYHRTNHRVVYATARADLLELVGKGYLICEQANKAFIFRPDPDIKSRMRYADGDRQDD
jgi:Fic family protein